MPESEAAWSLQCSLSEPIGCGVGTSKHSSSLSSVPLLFCVLICRFLSPHSASPPTALMHVCARARARARVCVCVCVSVMKIMMRGVAVGLCVKPLDPGSPSGR